MELERSETSNVRRLPLYPLLIAPIAATALSGPRPGWGLALVVAGSLLLIAGLERRRPAHRRWNQDHGDSAADVVLAVCSFGLLALASTVVDAAARWSGIPALWPDAIGHAGNVLLAGLVVDLGLYAMHRASHRVDWLWRLHAVHHASERLYWLNAERRHPLSALVLAGPSLVVLAMLGAPPDAVSAWFAVVAVHLGLQHANLDDRLGWLGRWLAVAESHRLHHLRVVDQGQVNFGEVFLIWDRCFGTFGAPRGAVPVDAIGLDGENAPKDWAGLLAWPFRRRGEDR